jgi:type II pantothenate kinase
MTPSTVVGIDFGASNTDVVARTDDGTTRHWLLPTAGAPSPDAVRRALATGGVTLTDCAWLAVTGGDRRALPASLDGVAITGVDEVSAIGRGGRALAGVDEALVTSAGSGTAVVAASPAGARHVTGTGVGGGTLVGLARLLCGVTDPHALDALASQGRDAVLNLTIEDVIGGAIGSLPADTTAVNFGRVARHPVDASPADTVAALVNLVGQVIGVLTINAARAERLEHAVIVGHLTDMPSIRRVLALVARYYGATLTLPPDAGRATALGALLVVSERTSGV